MDNSQDQPPQNAEKSKSASAYSLRELIDLITGRTIEPDSSAGETIQAELQPFPFMAIVGQQEMKIALLLALVNPAIGGVLLIGPRGTGKTTAVRSLVDLLPTHQASLCRYGCLPEDIEAGGMDAVCPDCARKFGEGQPLTKTERARIVELPLNARLEDVIGGIDEHEALHNRLRLKPGLLAQADRNLLYVDEVNLLSAEIADAILDAAAMGTYSVRRGPISATYRSRLTLIGAMNPEEGNLRPQILDRFGLRVFVRGLESQTERIEAFHRVSAYQKNPFFIISQFADATAAAQKEVQLARDRLPTVMIPESVASKAINLARTLKIDSLRAEITLLQASRALAAIDGRNRVELDDIKYLAPLALRLRQTQFIKTYFEARVQEEKELNAQISSILE